MKWSYFDFFFGFFLLNATSHLIYGLLNIRFLSLFGFSTLGNISYAFVNVAVVLVLFHIHYGIKHIQNYGFILGAAGWLLLYSLVGRFVYQLFL